ncbi:MAG: septal ring lytic transglycosylase RlpA family protein [Desulfobacterales bacterium]|nr:septal ring lytic transglycosylase RlpA family protein [Desulfobacterales bacterium]
MKKRPQLHTGVRLAWLAATVAAAVLLGCAGSPPGPSSRQPPQPGKDAKAPAAPKIGSKPYRVGKNWYHPLPHAHGFSQRGLASWYGKDFHGRKTSNGEVYNMYALTAAHKTLPLGTWVRVRNLQNGRSLDVRINDRGPFVRGRVIDLSYTAASRLGVVGPGTAPVEIVALASPGGAQPATVDFTRGDFTFQVGAFKVRENAIRLRDKLAKKYKHAHVQTYDTGVEKFYRVRVGRCTSLDQAEEYEQLLIADGFSEVFIVAE